MKVTISIEEPLAKALKTIAQREHRSLSSQIAFFCDRGVSNLEKPLFGDRELPTPPAIDGAATSNSASADAAKSEGN